MLIDILILTTAAVVVILIVILVTRKPTTSAERTGMPEATGNPRPHEKFHRGAEGAESDVDQV